MMISLGLVVFGLLLLVGGGELLLRGAVTLLLFPVMFTGRRISRREGFLLLASYGLYLALLLGRA